jgi:2-polyprenyl-6-methoxyphenol hydroxylase-like FAD-dependent oxidoreductase
MLVDAAHAMSPIGGVGINLAVHDAVAAANLLARPLRDGTLSTRHLARVQLRRILPTIVVQRAQRTIQNRFLPRARRQAGRHRGSGRPAGAAPLPDPAGHPARPEHVRVPGPACPGNRGQAATGPGSRLKAARAQR